MRKIIINIIDSLSVRKYIQRVINLLSKWYSLASNPWKTLKLISFLWLPSVVKDTYLRFLIVIMTTKYALLKSLSRVYSKWVMHLCPDFVDLNLNLDETNGYGTRILVLWMISYLLSSRTQARTSHETDNNDLSQTNSLL